MPSCDELLNVLLTSTSSPADQLKAAADLSVLPITPRAWRTFVGALPALVELIKQPSNSTAVRQRVLLELLPNIVTFEHGDNHVEEVTAEVIGSIVQLLQHGSDLGQCTAANVLRELSSHTGNLARMIAAGAVGRLVPLLKSKKTTVQATSATALSFISDNGVEGARCIAAAGAVPPLVRLLLSRDEPVQLYVRGTCIDQHLLEQLQSPLGHRGGRGGSALQAAQVRVGGYSKAGGAGDWPLGLG